MCVYYLLRLRLWSFQFHYMIISQSYLEVKQPRSLHSSGRSRADKHMYQCSFLWSDTPLNHKSAWPRLKLNNRTRQKRRFSGDCCHFNAYFRRAKCHVKQKFSICFRLGRGGGWGFEELGSPPPPPPHEMRTQERQTLWPRDILWKTCQNNIL